MIERFAPTAGSKRQQMTIREDKTTQDNTSKTRDKNKYWTSPEDIMQLSL
jgi:hypothetical protein